MGAVVRMADRLAVLLVRCELERGRPTCEDALGALLGLGARLRFAMDRVIVLGVTLERLLFVHEFMRAERLRVLLHDFSNHLDGLHELLLQVLLLLLQLLLDRALMQHLLLLDA